MLPVVSAASHQSFQAQDTRYKHSLFRS